MSKNKSARKKLGAKWFTAIIGSLLAVLIAFAIALPCITIENFDGVLRDVFGTAGREGPDNSSTTVDTAYNKSSFKNTAELVEHENELVRKIDDEGYVLLHNSEEEGKGLPISTSAAKKTKISLFSHSSVDLIVGGTGSGSGNGKDVTGATLKEALEEQNFEVNSTLWNFYESGKGKDYTRGPGSINYGDSENWVINECPLSELQSGGVLDSVKNTIPVYVLSRTGGEGMDLARYMGKFTNIAEDKTKHYLEPDSVELAIINYLNTNFDNIILVVNTNNVFELGWVKDYAHITSVLWTPGGGCQSANAIADIISGKVSPSGHLVDTIAYDSFSSPAMKNMGDFQYSVNGSPVAAYGISYDEGIYVGYKYYETRYFDKVMNQGNAGNYEYKTTVQYPFGFGKSYTNFTWSDFSVSEKDADGNIDVKVTVTNDENGVPGKDVVQVYVSVPYTKYDKDNYIEKSAVSLVGFKKTGLLDAGAKEEVTVTVNVKDFISYDDVEAKTFILEDGDYLLTAASDAHEATNNILAYNDKSVEDGMTAEGNKAMVGLWNNSVFDKTTYATSSTGEKVTNRFDASNYIERSKYLSRRDWVETFPITHGNQNGKVATNLSEQNGYVFIEEISQELLNKINAKGTAAAANSPIKDSDVAAKAGSLEKEGTMELIDIRGLAYEDIDWESLLSRMTAKEIGAIINKAGYCTHKADSINKPYAKDLDGPSGLNLLTNHALLSILYPAEVTIAATWDKDYSAQVGDAIAEDGLTSTKKSFGKVNGWYGPAMNIHRTPFAGRNFEYYSEDSFISGEMAREAVVGAAKKGMYAFVKHFALNDQENHRTGDRASIDRRSGICTWSNEQAMREIYFKPFQTVIVGNTVTTRYYEPGDSNTFKESQTPACMAVMSSFNRIGYTWAGGDYRLITQVLRNEWGFNGMVETDYSEGATSYMHTEQMLRAGGDVQLSQVQASYTIKNDAMKYYAKEAMKHVLYCVANSNAMNGYIHGVQVPADPFAYYYLILIAVGVVAAGLSTWGGIAIWQRWKKELAQKKSGDDNTDAHLDISDKD